MNFPKEIYYIICEYAKIKCVLCRIPIKNDNLNSCVFYKPGHWFFHNFETIYFCNKKCCDYYTNME